MSVTQLLTFGYEKDANVCACIHNENNVEKVQRT